MAFGDIKIPGAEPEGGFQGTDFKGTFGVDIGDFASSLFPDADPDQVKSRASDGLSKGMTESDVAKDAVDDAKEGVIQSYAQRLADIESKYGAEPQAAAEAKAQEQIRGQKMMRILAGITSGIAGQNPESFRKSLESWNAEARRPVEELRKNRETAIQGLGLQQKMEGLDRALETEKGGAPAVHDLYRSITGKSDLNGIPIDQIPSAALQELLGPALQLRGQDISSAGGGTSRDRDPLTPAMKKILTSAFPDQAEAIGELTTLPEGRLSQAALGGSASRGGIQGRYDTSAMDRDISTFDRDAKKLREGQDQAGKARAAIRQALTNPIAAAGAAALIARVAGEVGVLTDKDVARYQGTQALLGRAEQIYQTAISGTLTEQNLKDMLAFVDELDKAIEFGISQKAGRHAERISKRRGVEPKEAWGLLVPEIPYPEADDTESQKADIKRRYKAGEITKEEAIQAVKALNGK